MQHETEKKVNNRLTTKKMKPVYFNIHNPKEKELYDWVNGRFATFGGLVKDLLYTQMLLEMKGQTIKIGEGAGNYTPVDEQQLNINDMEKPDISYEDVEDYDC